MADEKEREFVLGSGRGPAVRFTGWKLSHASEDGERCVVYRTVGKNYILQLISKYGGSEVKDFNKASLVVGHLKMLERRSRSYPGAAESPRDWSPRADYGVSEMHAKLIMGAGVELSQFLVRDVK